MAESLADQIICKSKQAAELHHRLILLIGPAGAGKTAALRKVKERTGVPLVNVTLELSRRMLDLTRRQRSMQLPVLFREVVENGSGEMILLDNLEGIFDVGLQQDPLRLLQGLSRNRTVVAAWSGTILDDFLTYAVPGHSEYRRYSIQDVLTVSPNATPSRQQPPLQESRCDEIR